MISFAMESPVREYDFWAGHTDFDFVLAHKVLEDRLYADQLARRPPNRLLMLDNSMHELGEPLDARLISKAADLCVADIVIAPDSFTASAGQNRAWLRAMARLSCGWSVAAVMHGNNHQELVDSVKNAEDLGCGTLCLPYKKPRLQWYLDYLTSGITFGHIHLLGINEMDELENFGADMLTVDSGKPYKWGSRGVRMEHLRTVRSLPDTISSKGLLDVPRTPRHAVSTILENIAYVKRVCGQ